MAYLTKVAGGLYLILFGYSCTVADSVVHYPRAESTADERVNYYAELLQLCLLKSGKPYQIAPSRLFAEQARGLQLVESNRGLDVIWAVTTREREERLLPIRIPIDRGLFGWRLFLIKQSNQHLFDVIETADQLAKLRTGQGLSLIHI